MTQGQGTREVSSGAGSWLSGVQALRAYQRSCLPRDVVAGSFMYAIVGPSRILVLGPDSSLAPLIAAAILPLAAGRDAEAVALAGLLAIFSGLLCVLAGLARFGFIADLLSKPVRYGNMNGIALTVLLSQLPKLVGFSIDAEGVIPEARAFSAGLPTARRTGRH